MSFGWPASFLLNFQVDAGNISVVSVITPAFPPAVSSLLLPYLSTAGYFFRNYGSEYVPNPSFSYNLSSGGTLLSLGTVDANRTVNFTQPGFLFPTTANVSTVAYFYADGEGDAFTQFRVAQPCFDPTVAITRSLCTPPGTVDYYADPASMSPFGGIVAYKIGVAGCSVNPDECDVGSPACCLAGWTQVANLTGVTSCGNLCWNCSAVCAPPSPTPTGTPSPTSSMTASQSSTPSLTRSSVSGAVATGRVGSVVAAAAAVAAATLLLSAATAVTAV